MKTRLIIAYSPILVMTLLALGVVAYRIHHSHERSYRRRLRKERCTYGALQVPPGP
jgi:hypothetical protein